MSETNGNSWAGLMRSYGVSDATAERLDELQDALDGIQAALGELRKEATPDRAELLTLRLRAMAERGRDLTAALAG